MDNLKKRPKRQFTEREIEQLETMAALGLPRDKMAAILSISKSYMRELIKKDSAAQKAIEKGEAIASYNLLKTGYDMATSGKCPTMTIFFLKCKENFREAYRLDLSAINGGEEPEIIDVTPSERKERIKMLQKHLEVTEDE
jgi:hypothetical protein